MQTAIVGGGAAGFFLAVNLKEQCPQMGVTIFERTQHPLAKVLISGGGRCNCTNTFRDVRDLQAVYPRGHRLMKRLMKGFSERDAYAWFERHGVSLTTQEDQCVFPASQDAHTIANCFLGEARRRGVEVRLGQPVSTLAQLDGYDFIAVTTGGSPKGEGLRWLADCGHTIAPPVPSLFTFKIDDVRLHQLMGTVVDEATAYIPGTAFRASGPLLLTHWGMSGPAILKLSSHAARHLAEHDYRLAVAVNWVSRNDDAILRELWRLCADGRQRQLTSLRPFGLPTRLWHYLVAKCLGQRAESPWGSLNKKEVNRLANTLANDSYQLAGRAAFKEEFVTCGGVDLSSVKPATLESRHVPRLFFAGEVLDVDGVTGGFNFQAAWTTAYTVARAISREVSDGTAI